MDVRDSLFQLDPFGLGSPVVKGLQVFEEHKNQTLEHWLTKWPIETCKGKIYTGTMLCSGTTVGTRAAMLRYLEAMYAEMKVWINEPKCRFGINGDDQSIHNYLYYSGQLPFATAIANRAGGIVNTVGVEAANIARAHQERLKKDENLDEDAAMAKPFSGADGPRWLGKEFGLVDDQGFFTEFDGTRSRVIHQYDRFGTPYFKWLQTQDFVQDGLPSASKGGNEPAAVAR
jgi:hypothetical protein